MRIISLLIVFGFALAACSGGEGDSAAGAEEQSSLSEPMTDAVEKAEAVEATVMEHKEAVDEAVDDTVSAAEDIADDAEEAAAAADE